MESNTTSFWTADGSILAKECKSKSNQVTNSSFSVVCFLFLVVTKEK